VAGLRCPARRQIHLPRQSIWHDRHCGCRPWDRASAEQASRPVPWPPPAMLRCGPWPPKCQPSACRWRALTERLTGTPDPGRQEPSAGEDGPGWPEI